MGNFCGKPNANANGKLSLKQWLGRISAPGVTKEVARWTTRRSRYAENVAAGATYHMYFIAKDGHLEHTFNLKKNIVVRFAKMCQGELSASHIRDSMVEYMPLVLCMRRSIPDMMADPSLKDRDILDNFVGLCMCAAYSWEEIAQEHHTNIELDPDRPNALYVDTICSDCRQGGKMLEVLEGLTTEKQIEIFGRPYSKIFLSAIESAYPFYVKQGYSVHEETFTPHGYTMVKPVVWHGVGTGGRRGRGGRGGRPAVVQTGPKGGRYVVLGDGTKKYLKRK